MVFPYSEIYCFHLEATNPVQLQPLFTATNKANNVQFTVT